MKNAKGGKILFHLDLTISPTKESSGSFRKEESSIRRDNICREIIEILKSLTNWVKKDDSTLLRKDLNHDLLLRMFETYKETNDQIIENLINENNFLKNELMSLNCLNKLTMTRFQEIEELCKKAEKGRNHYGRKNSLKKYYSDSCVSFNSTKTSMSNMHIFDNFNKMVADKLNTIKWTLKEMNMRMAKKDSLIKQLKKIEKIQDEDTIKERRDTVITRSLIPVENSFIASRRGTDGGCNMTFHIPRWIPDHLVKNCASCSRDFGFFTRKHHCRKCGDIFCYSCCNKYDFFLPYYSTKVRQCQVCYNKK